LYASLDNAGKLNEAGVTVGMAVLADSAHNLYQLRFSAGNAVAHKLPKAAAIAGISGYIADMFGLEGGIIAPGKPADLALWSGDPLDVSGSLDTLWIAGQQRSTRTRADALRDRYLDSSGLLTGEKAELPPAYLR
jgi:imidazolonepropionase-like amidohydrolase